MNWYLQRGNKSDVVFNTKISFYRNLRNYKFDTNNQKEIEEIENLVKSKLPSIGYNLKYIKIKDMNIVDKQSLFEKNLINQTTLNSKKSSILINDEENICIILNGQNHIEIQVFNSGMEIENVYNLAREIDEKFDKMFEIAKNKKYGYLTTVPINVGTGLKATITIHLPGLKKTGNIRAISETVNNFGLDFAGKYIKNSEVIGDIYEISNKQTLGISEETIINNIKIISNKIVEQERKARKLMTQNPIELENSIYRQFGLLTYSKLLTWEEALKLLSDIKMGTDLGIIKELDDNKIAKMYLYINSANLQKYMGENLEAYDRDIKRAELIKQIINEK